MKFFLGLFFSLFLTGCEFINNLNLGVFAPMGEIAMQQKHLLIVCVLLMLIVVIPAIVMVPIFAWKYRASNSNAEFKPKWGHSTLIEIVCWGSSSIIVTILAILTWTSSHKLDPYRELENTSKPIKIQAVALQWKWLFIYPEYGIAMVNYLQFPVNVSLNVEITADAPMNSLTIPQLGGQIYAMEGMTTKIHWIANEEGEFRGHSSNYSGIGFSGMNFKAKATSQKEFDAFVKDVKSLKHPLSMEAYEKLAERSINNQREFFSSVEPDLFGKVLGKFTKYMPHHSAHGKGKHDSHRKNKNEHHNHH